MLYSQYPSKKPVKLNYAQYWQKNVAIINSADFVIANYFVGWYSNSFLPIYVLLNNIC